ncbi:hypothetical protein [Paraoerskovia sediminicola]|uniref:DUF7927 domain-containing protein n=1 Tax=Paraoerskovia sediminicola TaxID=1138587 RepID=UPI0025731A86|nr:hypothetical protein [Paraoerskovia sediminicola]
MDDPATGDGDITNAVTGPPESTCVEGTDPGCTVTTPVRSLDIVKSSNAPAQVLPGTDVVYTVTVTNTGQFAYTLDDPAIVADDLTEVLDDATLDEGSLGATTDGANAPDAPTYSEPTIEWSGALDPGETVTLTYTVTVDDPATGDGVMTNTVVGPPESTCDPDQTPEDPECTVTVPVRSLDVSKSSDVTEAELGDTVTYTLTVENTGGVDYTELDPAAVFDDLDEVLDDATFVDGSLTTEVTPADPATNDAEFDGDSISWSGPLAAGQTVTITYSVVVADPATGDGVLDNTVVGPPESSCDPAQDPADPGCTVTVPVRSLALTKTATPVDGVALGDTITYTVTVENTGQAPYTAGDPADFSDSLTDVLDDATWDDTLTATSDNADAGTGEYVEPTVTWSGPLDPGEVATITYTLTVNDPGTGDGVMTNAVTGPPEANCPDPAVTDPQDPAFDADCVTEVPTLTPALEIDKTSDAGDEVLPGDEIVYTVVVTNTGETSYTVDDPAEVTDDLSEVLDDGAVTDGPAVTSDGADPGTVSLVGDEITWSGPLEPGESATITYTVTVDDPGTGDGVLTNTVTGPPESTCPEVDPDDGPGEGCVVVTPVRRLEIAKTSTPSSDPLLPGGTVEYTVTVTNTGGADYVAPDLATFTDDLSDVLDDATVTAGPTADVGTATLAGTTLSWEGELPVDGVATVTYTVTVADPVTGDGVLTNVVTGPRSRAASTAPRKAAPPPRRCRRWRSSRPPRPTRSWPAGPSSTR